METCVACGAELGVGRFCLNCGHPIGAPAPQPRVEAAPPPPVVEPAAPVQPAPVHPADPPAPAPPDASEREAVRPEAAREPVPPAPAEPEPVAAPDPAPATPEPAAAASAASATAPRPARGTPVSAPPRPRWDPDEEMLPYEEFDDVDDDPVRGRAWMVWVAVAVVLVGLVFVLLEVLGTDDDATTDAVDSSGETSAPARSGSDDPASTTEAGDAPAGTGKRLDLASGASFEVPGTAPPTQDFDGNLVAYEASQMQDDNPTTAWRTAGDATGQRITITLPEPGVVDRVGLVNGYAKTLPTVDWYPNNRRILSVTWTFDDGTSVQQTFAERPGMQQLKVTPVETATVVLTIDSVTPPGSGNLGRDYTAISEVSITGRRAA